MINIKKEKSKIELGKGRMVKSSKFIFLVVALLMLSTVVSAADFNIFNQSSPSSSYFMVNGSSGNVGIGTTTPMNKLSVQGDALISGDLSLANLIATGTLSVIGASTLNGTLHVQTGSSGGSASANADDLVVESGTTGGISVLVPQASNGNVYFGTNQQANEAIMRWQRTAGTMSMGTNIASGQLRLMTGNFVERVRIGYSGNVGIGTTTPANLLNVAGDANVTGTLYAGSFSPSDLVTGTLNTSGQTLLATSSGNVGIGTTSLGSGKLTIESGGSNNGISLYHGNGYDYGQLYSDASHNFYLQASRAAATNLYLGTVNAQQALTVQGGTGNIGIGTTTPTAELEIAGTTSKDYQLLLHNGAPAYGYQIGRQYSAGATSGFLRFYGNQTGYAGYTFNNFDNGALMTITNAGNVGIGTTSPANKLTVNGTIRLLDDSVDGNRYIITEETNTGTGKITIQAGAGSASYGGALNLYANNHTTHPGDVVAGISSSSGGSFRVANWGTDGGQSYFSVRGSDGYTGIGTITPANLLNVAGDANVTGTLYAGSFSPSDLVTGTLNTSGQTLLATSSGNVGIGTTTPSQKLEVTGNVQILGGATNNALILNVSQAGSTSIVLNGYVDSADGRNWAIRNRYSNYGLLEFMRSTDNVSAPLTTAAAFDKSGNLGIGTTNPQNKLSVNGNVKLIGSVNNSVTLGFGSDDGVTGWSIGNGVIDNTHNFRIYDNTAGLSRVTVDDSGNVGIGTTSPGQNVAGGTADLSGHIFAHVGGSSASNNYFGGNTVSLYFDDTSGAVDDKFLQLILDNGILNMNSFTDVLALRKANIMSWDMGNGNVGIGTTTPANLLNVAGDANVTGTLYAGSFVGDGSQLTGVNSGLWTNSSGNATFTSGNVGIGTTAPTVKLEVNGGNFLLNGSYPVIKIQNNPDGTYGGGLRWLNNAGTSKWALGPRVNIATDAFEIAEGASTRLFIENVSGNVGIGTTTPTVKLDVNGGIKTFSSYTTYTGDGFSANGTRGFKMITPGGADWIDAAYYSAGAGRYPASMRFYSPDATVSRTYATPFLFREINGTNYLELRNNGGAYFKGDVGIGTTSLGTGSILTVDGNISVGARRAITPSVFGYNSAWKSLILGSTGTAYGADATTISFGYDPSNNPSGAFAGDGSEILFRNYTLFLQANASDTGYLHPFSMRNGNVGIGTGSPNYLLDMETTGSTITHNIKVDTVAAAGNYGEIAFQTWTGAGSGINEFGGTGTSRPSVVLRGLSEDSSARGAFVVATFEGGADNSLLTEKFRITSGGNVGIGTSSPTSKLNIFGGSLNISQSGTDVIINSTGILFSDGSFQSTAGVGTSGFTDNGGTIVLSTTTDNVSIGSSVAGAKFDILDTAEQLRLSYDANNYASLITSIDGGLTVRAISQPTSDLTLDADNLVNIGSSTADAINLGRTAADITTTINGGLVVKDVINSLTAFQFQNSASGVVLDIDTTNARIGVNTATPTHALNVVGDANITGQLYVGTGTTKINSTGILFSDGSFQSSASSNSTGGVPLGAIISYTNVTPPAGWLIADGSNLSRTTYVDLFNVIGTQFGSGDGSTTFTLPDLRGIFVRGLDNGTGNDPDAASRIASGSGGATGDNIGSYQADTFKSHTHTGVTQQGSPAAAPGGAGIGVNAAANPTAATGGNETRPKNLYLVYIIKAENSAGTTAGAITANANNVFTGTNTFQGNLKTTGSQNIQYRSIWVEGGTDQIVTGSVWTDVNNMDLNITLLGSQALVEFQTGATGNGGSGVNDCKFRVNRDSNGELKNLPPVLVDSTASYHSGEYGKAIFSGLSSGVHNFKIQVKSVACRLYPSMEWGNRTMTVSELSE